MRINKYLFPVIIVLAFLIFLIASLLIGFAPRHGV